jgi:hypothetical protein
MDVLTDISYGHPWGCLATDEDVGKWFEDAELLLPNVIMVSTIPWLARLFAIPVIGRLVMPSDKDKTGAGRILGQVKDLLFIAIINPGIQSCQRGGSKAIRA